MARLRNALSGALGGVSGGLSAGMGQGQDVRLKQLLAKLQNQSQFPQGPQSQGLPNPEGLDMDMLMKLLGGRG